MKSLMMTLFRNTLAGTGLVMGLASVALADREVICESHDNGYNTCYVGNGVSMRLSEVLSHAPCIPNQTFGFQDGYIWVNQGCRAAFQVSYRPRPPHEDVRIIRCESNDYRYNSCIVGRAFNVQLYRQLSTARCDAGYTWGFDPRNGIVWVDQGCRGEFLIGR